MKTLKKIHGKNRKTKKNKKGGAAEQERIRLNAQHVKKTTKCNTERKGNKVTPQSCLTSNEVHIAAHAFNKKNPNNPVKSHNPAQLWAQLQQRLYTKCKGEERCVIQATVPEEQREKLEDDAFKPEKPKEMVKDPNAWLSNIDIEEVLEQYEKNPDNHFAFVRPTSIDFDTYLKSKNGCVDNAMCHFQVQHYLKKGVKKIGIVFNTDKHTEGGSHWISLFIDLEDKFMMFFDSTGDPMPKEVKVFMDRVQKQAFRTGIRLQVFNNEKVEHQQGSTECGMYSLFFIITMLKGTTDFTEGTLSKEQKLDMFLKKFEIPDEVMTRYRDVYFD
jgi:hypothetical protein